MIHDKCVNFSIKRKTLPIHSIRLYGRELRFLLVKLSFQEKILKWTSW